jgi:cytochrome b
MLNQGQAVRVWDMPTRVFHWSLVILIGFSWWSAETRHMEWHMLSGFAVLALVTFRVIWGFIGSSTARFGQFVRSPLAVLAYMRSDSSHPKPVGHNPIGGYSVILMLLLLSVQIGTGLFATDVDGLDSGPLSFLVDFDQGRKLSGIHHLSFSLLQIIVLFHVLAILFYLVIRKRNLISAMITGADKQLQNGRVGLAPAGLLRFIIAAIIAAVTAWAANKGFFLG